MRFRSIDDSDLDRVVACTVTEPVRWSDPERLAEYLASGAYHNDRIWIAVDDDDRILARAVWWSFPGQAVPLALDCLWVDPSAADPETLAVDLLDAAHTAFRGIGMAELPGHHMFLAEDWRDDPAAVATVDRRRRVLARAGMTDELERVRFEWTPDAGVPEPSTRLSFAPEDDDEVFVDLFRRTAEGSLDVDTHKTIAKVGEEANARETLDVYLTMPGDRSMWRIARRVGDESGEPVGFTLPSANSGGPVVGYIGVLPESRGHGYSNDLLNEITRIHAADGARRIAADTDATNTPMRRSFERCGYRPFAVRLVIDAPA